MCYLFRYSWLSLFLLASHVPLFSQSSDLPFFSTFYFEDAVGNKDTVWVGGHEAAEAFPELPDEAFGEYHNPVPFDSIFEVRGILGYEGEGYDIPGLLADTLILPFQYCINCPDESGNLNAPAAFLIHAKHKPVTIRWDSTHWNDAPRRQSVIMQNAFILQHPVGWYDGSSIPDSLFSCMAIKDSLKIDFSQNLGLTPWSKWPVYGSPHTYDTLPAVHINNIGVGVDPFSPCPYLLPVSVSDPLSLNEELKRFTIFPNPVRQQIQLLTKHPTISTRNINSAKLYDLSGREVRRWDNYLNGYQVAQLASGIYFLQLQIDGRTFERHKIIIQ
ncbi:MAG: T9SS type A sorting domain-containing protein [Bacteroidota bacterium]